MKLKQLQEKRGSLNKQIREIIDNATVTESRSLNADEASKVEAIEAEINLIDQTIHAEMRQMDRETKAAPDLSRQEERDLGQFNFGRVVRHLDRVFRGQPSTLDGIEAEMIQQGESESRSIGINSSGLALPQVLLAARESRATLSVTGGTTTQYGGKLVGTEKQGLLGDFYNRGALEAAGALVLTGLVGNLDLPRYTQGTAPLKKTENEAAGDVAGTFSALSLAPKRLPGYAVISDQLLAQSDQNIASFTLSQIERAMKSVQEIAYFHGGGTSEPTGIAGTSGIGSVAGGTNGAAMTWANIVALWKEVSTDNADIGALGYFTNTKVLAKLLTTAKVSSTDSQMIMNELNSLVLGFPVRGTNAIKSNLTKGTANGTCSALFFGNANDFVIGYWGGVMLEVVRDTTDAKAGQRTLVANTYYDAGVLRPSSFAACLDVLTA